MTYLQVALILMGAFVMPWWWLGIVGLFTGWVFCSKYNKSRILISSFLSGFMVWGVFAYYFDLKSSGEVGHRLALMFHLSWEGLPVLITALLGGLIVYLSAWWGVQLRTRFR